MFCAIAFHIETVAQWFLCRLCVRYVILATINSWHTANEQKKKKVPTSTDKQFRFWCCFCQNQSSIEFTTCRIVIAVSCAMCGEIRASGGLMFCICFEFCANHRRAIRFLLVPFLLTSTENIRNIEILTQESASFDVSHSKCIDALKIGPFDWKEVFFLNDFIRRNLIDFLQVLTLFPVNKLKNRNFFVGRVTRQRCHHAIHSIVSVHRRSIAIVASLSWNCSKMLWVAAAVCKSDTGPIANTFYATIVASRIQINVQPASKTANSWK